VTRAFVAIRPSDAVLDAVEELVGSLDLGDTRRTTRDQWHVTLQFLGNRADVAAVIDALTGLHVPAGGAQLGGLGAFPNPRRARVLWLGVAEGGETFGALAREVGARLAPLGHEPEARPYHAHLTLARAKVPTDLRPLVDAHHRTAVGESWPVSEVVVYESRLRQTGAEYIPRAAVGLQGPS
jgi:2'-5' RNA ligase